MHLFCLHHAGGTTASFAGWRFAGMDVTKLGYRGRDFPSVSAAADALAGRIGASPSPEIALYGHSMGAILAFEAALRLQHTGRVAHVFLAAARPPSGMHDGGAAATALAASAGSAALSGRALSSRAREVLLEDLALLARYPGRPPAGQLEVPATVLFSPDDPVVPAADTLRWASWCSAEPRLHEIPGGHLFHLGNPAVLAIVETTLSPAPGDVPAGPGTAAPVMGP
ncbi:thioesterase II family protein [Arthrobacter sp. CJ23]|uniref:thioesterase II family protein n=1 Tax=Arthrobacter sp. CJ23 TaxID=2972479 RepID=UPI00215D50A9|nr:alpha/beta fold hydrolase [Arthrobacter sp. CJ23]UVJ39024.1 alpha/beta fold hydrolase [Arthrobacter sp. CJ23]